METVVSGKVAGVVLGQQTRPFPGLTPVTKKLHAALAEVAALEESRYELDQVRATLLLNFGATTYNRYGFVITDKGSTLALLLDVLRRSFPAAGSTPTADKPEGEGARE